MHPTTSAPSLLAELTTDTLLIRPPHGGRPSLHFKSRGSESVWSTTLSNIIAQAHGPHLNHQTLLAIGPHLIQAMEEVGGHVQYRQYNSIQPYNTGEWTRRLYKTPSDTLGYVHARLIRLCRKYTALDLINRFFPARMEEIGSDEPWNTIFERFLDCVRAEDWFPLDECSLDTAKNALQYEPDDDGEWLAEYMTIIPLPALAPVEELLEDSTIRILYGLFVNPWLLERGDLSLYGIDEPQKLNDEAISSRIQTRKMEFSNYEFPLAFIPDIARLYRRETGYDILDTPGFEGVVTPFGSFGDFTWEDDVSHLRQQWREVSPLVDRYNAFHQWIDEDGSHFDRAVDLILRAGGVI